MLPSIFSKITLRTAKRCKSATFVRWNSSKPDLTVNKRINVFSVSLLAIPITTFCLGTWQVKRRKWKLGLIKDLEDKMTRQPVEFPNDLSEFREMEYEKIKVEGKFDHSKEIYISPRSKITKGDVSQEGSGLLSSSSNHGAYVVTPFTLADKDMTILVNRGWVQRKQINPETRKNGQVEGTIELVGVVRKSDKQAPFVPNNDPNSKFWHFRDINAMAETLDSSPIFLDADYASTVGGGPIGGQTKVTLRNEHLSYIITWYSLSILTAYMWYQRFCRIPK